MTPLLATMAVPALLLLLNSTVPLLVIRAVPAVEVSLNDIVLALT
jgi:hypothetical protein